MARCHGGRDHDASAHRARWLVTICALVLLGGALAVTGALRSGLASADTFQPTPAASVAPPGSSPVATFGPQGATPGTTSSPTPMPSTSPTPATTPTPSTSPTPAVTAGAPSSARAATPPAATPGWRVYADPILGARFEFPAGWVCAPSGAAHTAVSCGDPLAPDGPTLTMTAGNGAVVDGLPLATLCAADGTIEVEGFPAIEQFVATPTAQPAPIMGAPAVAAMTPGGPAFILGLVAGDGAYVLSLRQHAPGITWQAFEAQQRAPWVHVLNSFRAPPGTLGRTLCGG